MLPDFSKASACCTAGPAGHSSTKYAKSLFFLSTNYGDKAGIVYHCIKDYLYLLQEIVNGVKTKNERS